MKQIKFRSRTEHVLRTTYIVMYAFRSNTELLPVFQSTGNLVPFGIPAESGRNVPPRLTKCPILHAIAAMFTNARAHTFGAL